MSHSEPGAASAFGNTALHDHHTSYQYAATTRKDPQESTLASSCCQHDLATELPSDWALHLLRSARVSLLLQVRMAMCASKISTYKSCRLARLSTFHYAAPKGEPPASSCLFGEEAMGLPQTLSTWLRKSRVRSLYQTDTIILQNRRTVTCGDLSISQVLSPLQLRSQACTALSGWHRGNAIVSDFASPPCIAENLCSVALSLGFCNCPKPNSKQGEPKNKLPAVAKS